MAFATIGIPIGIGCGARSGEPLEPFERDTNPAPLDSARLETAIESTVEYIIRHTAESGRFTYVLDRRGRSDSGKYNVLRHGGTIYALGEYRRRQGASPELDDAIRRSARYLVANHLGSFAPPRGIGDADSVAVWSRVGEEIKGYHRQAKLGGAGLGLVALTTAREVDESVVSIETLRGLALTIASMQKEDGHFVSKVIEGGGPDKTFISLYYPGEAVLGLARLYRIDRDPRWVGVAGKAIEALMTMRADVPDDELPADHWLLIAIGEIAALAKDKPEIAKELSVSVEAMLAHAIRIADAMLEEQRRAGADGSFNPERRSTPTATRLEGIFALLAVLDDSNPARRRLENGARAGARFLLGCVVNDGEASRLGGIVRECPDGGRGRRSEIRIDYAQHALSAFLGARAQSL